MWTTPLARAAFAQAEGNFLFPQSSSMTSPTSPFALASRMCSTNSSIRMGHALLSSKLERSDFIVCPAPPLQLFSA